MQYDYTRLKNNIKEIEEWLRKEYMVVRTGMASPMILDNVSVESYGQRMPIKQVASVTAADAKSLMVAPWDTSLIKAIEKAITAADLGVSLKTDEKGVRVFFPDLTSEKRVLLTKTLKEKLEQSKITLRSAREETIKDIDAKEEEGGMSEDEKFRFKADAQKLIEATSKVLEEIYSKKEKEILN